MTCGGDAGICCVDGLLAANFLPFSIFFKARKANTVKPMPAQSSSCKSRKSPTVMMS